MRIILVIVGLSLFSKLYSQTYALVADRMIDGKNDKIITNPTIIVFKNKIFDINTSGRYPDSAILINLKGFTLLAGLMDVHTHVLAGSSDYAKDLYENAPSFRALRAVSYLSTSLQNGFTTLRDVCSEGAGFADVDISRAIDAGFISGPRLFACGRGIAATNRYLPLPKFQNWELELPPGTQYATGTDECIKAVREQISRGVSWIKLYSDWGTATFGFEEIKAIVTEAQKYNVGSGSPCNNKGSDSYGYRGRG